MASVVVLQHKHGCKRKTSDRLQVISTPEKRLHDANRLAISAERTRRAGEELEDACKALFDKYGWDQTILDDFMRTDLPVLNGFIAKKDRLAAAQAKTDSAILSASPLFAASLTRAVV